MHRVECHIHDRGIVYELLEDKSKEFWLWRRTFLLLIVLLNAHTMIMGIVVTHNQCCFDINSRSLTTILTCWNVNIASRGIFDYVDFVWPRFKYNMRK